MLLIQEGNSVQRLEPHAVVEGILNGALARSMRTRAIGEATSTESALEGLLGTEHFRLLSSRLLRELRQCIVEREGYGLASLEKRLTDLSKWDLQPLGRYVHLRAKWLSAWLTERLGHRIDARSRYEEFLSDRLEIEEPTLGLLARNNLAVLRLQNGDLSSLGELATVALFDQLPGACFSLFNVIQITRRNETFPHIVEPVLREVIHRLPPGLRHEWIHYQTTEQEESERNRPLTESVVDGLVRRLVMHSKAMDSISRSGGLLLWPEPETGLLASPDSTAWLRTGPERHADYSEAVSVLYACKFPEGLPVTTRAGNVDALVSAAITEVRALTNRNEFVQARSTLEQAQNLIASSGNAGQLMRLEAELKKLASDLQQREAQWWEGELRSRITRLREAVIGVCQIVEPEEVRYRRQFLWPDFQEVRTLQRRIWEDGKTDLTAPLEEMLDRHIDKLEHDRRSLEIKELLGRLQELLPKSLDVAVNEEAYKVLKLCRTSDPNGSVHDWKQIEASLNRHNAQHHFHRAFGLACKAEHFKNLDEVEKEIRLAIGWDRAIASRAAPLLGLVHLRPAAEDAETLDALRSKLLDVSERLVAQPIFGGGKVIPPRARGELLTDALRELQRAVALFLRQKDDEEVAKRLFDNLQLAFEDVLADGEPDDIKSVCEMLQEWQTVWPDFFLPDHPFHCLLHRSEVSYCLQLAHAELREAATKERNRDEASVVHQHRSRAKEHVTEAIDRGLEPEQTKRAIEYYALAGPLAAEKDPEQALLLRALVKRFHAELGGNPRSLTTAWLDRAVMQSSRTVTGPFEDPASAEVVAASYTPRSFDDAFQEMRPSGQHPQESSESREGERRTDPEQGTSEADGAAVAPETASNGERGVGNPDFNTTPKQSAMNDASVATQSNVSSLPDDFEAGDEVDLGYVEDQRGETTPDRSKNSHQEG